MVVFLFVGSLIPHVGLLVTSHLSPKARMDSLSCILCHLHATELQSKCNTAERLTHILFMEWQELDPCTLINILEELLLLGYQNTRLRSKVLSGNSDSITSFNGITVWKLLIEIARTDRI